MEYTLIRSKRKTLCIQVTADADLLVRAPLRTPKSHIEDFLRQKEPWIQQKLHAARSRKQAKQAFTILPGDSILFLGKPHAVAIHEGAPYFNGTSFFVPKNTSNIKADLIALYRELALPYLEERTQHFALQMGIMPASIHVTTAKKQWGSCSFKGCIHFSFLLMMADPAAIDYVVVHELAHLREMNHSERFWQIVAQEMPDYAARKKQLRQLQDVLSTQSWSA